MATQDERESDAQPNFPPGIESKGDKYLYSELHKVNTQMHEIVKFTQSLPAQFDARVEPLSRLSSDVEKIRDEFTGFQGFRERIEKREKFVEDSVRDISKWIFRGFLGGIIGLGVATASVIATVAVYGFRLGSTITGISESVAQANKSVGEVKSSIDKIQIDMKSSGDKLREDNYALYGATKGHDERLKSMEEQFKDMRVSMRETPAKTAAETSDKAAERITGVLKAFEERTGKSNADLAGKLDAIERRAEEASDSLVLWLVLNPGDKATARSDTILTYHPPVPPQDKKVIIHGGQSRSKTIQAGVVNLYEGGELLKPPGVIAATARPMDDQGRVPIHLFFQDKAALERFEKVMDRLRDEHKPMH